MYGRREEDIMSSRACIPDGTMLDVASVPPLEQEKSGKLSPNITVVSKSNVQLRLGLFSW